MDVDDDEEEEAPPPPTRSTRKAPVRKPAPTPAAKGGRQTQLAFTPHQRTTESQASNALFHRNVVTIPSDDEDIEDVDSEDDFVPMGSQRGARRR
jgi:hypothetical protein